MAKVHSFIKSKILNGFSLVRRESFKEDEMYVCNIHYVDGRVKTRLLTEEGVLEGAKSFLRILSREKREQAFREVKD